MRIRGVILNSVLGLVMGAAQAAEGFGAPVAHAALDRVRGGFGSVDSGLWLAIGVQRSVSVDGQLTATSTVSARVENGTATALSGTDAVLLVQSGPRNTIEPAALRHASAALMVQNTLDGRHIEAVTAIEVSANSLQLLRSAAVQSALTEAVAASVRR